MTLPTNDILRAAARDKDLGGGPLRVLIELIGFADYETGSCYPSQNRIARALGITRQAVAQAMEKLVACGFLEFTKQNNEFTGAQTVNLYVIKLPNDPRKYSLPPRKPDLPPPQVQLVPPPQAELAPINVSNLEPTKTQRVKAPAKPKAKPQADAEKDFQAFLDDYPESPNKPAPEETTKLKYTLKAWKRTAKTFTPAEILLALKAYRAELVAKGTEARYITSPEKFLEKVPSFLRAAAESTVDDTWNRAIKLATAKHDTETISKILDAANAKDFTTANRIGKQYLTQTTEGSRGAYGA